MVSEKQFFLKSYTCSDNVQTEDSVIWDVASCNSVQYITPVFSVRNDPCERKRGKKYGQEDRRCIHRNVIRFLLEKRNLHI